MIFQTLIAGTFREAIAKKIFLGFLGISTLIILIFLFAVNVSSVEGMMNLMETSGDNAVRQVVIGFETFMLGVSYLLIITLCLISVSSFIPSMTEKGNIDILLSKPVSRAQIILGKFAGGVLLIFMSMVYLLGTIWLILSIKSGYWHFPFLYSIFWLTFSFAVIYSFVILIGLLTQSSVLTIIITVFLVFVVTPILGAREETIFTFVSSDVVKFILNFFYYILPKPGHINDITSAIIKNEAVKTYEPLITSFLFMLVMLSLSILYFKKKDY